MNNGVHGYPDGSRYEGQWLNSRRHGHGMWTKPDGTMYVGEWENDKPHGQGTLTWPSGKKYVGEWVKGKRHGQGVEIHPDGTKRFGVWEDGKHVDTSRLVVADESGTRGVGEVLKDKINELVENQEQEGILKNYTTPLFNQPQHGDNSNKSIEVTKITILGLSPGWLVLLAVILLGLFILLFNRDADNIAFLKSPELDAMESEFLDKAIAFTAILGVGPIKDHDLKIKHSKDKTFWTAEGTVEVGYPTVSPPPSLPGYESLQPVYEEKEPEYHYVVVHMEFHKDLHQWSLLELVVDGKKIFVK